MRGHRYNTFQRWSYLFTEKLNHSQYKVTWYFLTSCWELLSVVEEHSEKVSMHGRVWLKQSRRCGRMYRRTNLISCGFRCLSYVLPLTDLMSTRKIFPVLLFSRSRSSSCELQLWTMWSFSGHQIHDFLWWNVFKLIESHRTSTFSKFSNVSRKLLWNRSALLLIFVYLYFPPSFCGWISMIVSSEDYSSRLAKFLAC